MVEGIVVSLVLAIITSLAFIAYRHPSGFAKFYPWLISISFGLQVILGIVWNGAISAALLEITHDPKYQEAWDAVKELHFSAMLLSVIGIGTVVYLTILRGLPFLGIVAKEDGSGDKNT